MTTTVSKQQVLSLYRQVLRGGSKFFDYNFRNYVHRVAKEDFRKFAHETNEDKIKQLYERGVEQLGIVQRQASLNQMFLETIERSRNRKKQQKMQRAPMMRMRRTITSSLTERMSNRIKLNQNSTFMRPISQWAQAISDEQKQFEARTSFLITDSKMEDNIDAYTSPTIIRFDGSNFSSFTRPFHKPFDPHIHRALVLVGEELLKKYPVVTVYICSDEITMIFDPNAHRNDHIEKSMFMSGRIQKIVSMCASFVSVRFQHHLRSLLEPIYASEYNRADDAHYRCDSIDQVKQFWHEKPYYASATGELKVVKSHSKQSVDTHQHILKTLKDNQTIFDARVVILPSEADVLKNIVWRSKLDCLRNSKTLLARCYYSPKQMHAEPADSLVRKLQSEKSISWNDMPNAFKYGTFIKKGIVEQIGKNPITGEESVALRNIPKPKSFLLGMHEKHQELMCNFLFAKRWEDIDPKFWECCIESYE